MLDLNAVSVARRLSHLPVLVNPSLAAGQADIVEDLASAAAATGCDGVLIDAGRRDDRGWGGHRQALPMAKVETLVPRLRSISVAVGASLMRRTRARLACSRLGSGLSADGGIRARSRPGGCQRSSSGRGSQIGVANGDRVRSGGEIQVGPE